MIHALLFSGETSDTVVDSIFFYVRLFHLFLYLLVSLRKIYRPQIQWSFIFKVPLISE